MNEKKLIYMDEIHVPIILQDILKNAWLAVLAALAVCIGIFSYTNLVHQPMYTAEATFVVSPRSNGSYISFYSSLSTAKEMADVFKEVFSSDVLERLIKEELQQPNLSFSVDASVAEGTNILCVSVQADSPETAHKVIQSVLRNYRRVSGYLFGSVVLDILKKPQISVAPSNPVNLKRNMLLGAGMAVVAMVFLIALISVLRPTAKTLASAKRRMEEMPLGILQKEKRAVRLLRRRQKKPLLITGAGTSFQYTESLLQLAHRLRHRMQKDGMKVLLVTSVAENEGKSTVSANLALALAKHGYKVAYVDMDLRKPAAYKIFARLPREDLMTCLRDGIPASLDAPKRLHIFSNNRPVSGADKLLHSKELMALFQTLRKKMDFVIVDSAPYTATADTGMLLQYVDCCTMIIRQNWTSVRVCRDVADDLGACEAKYLGYVLNNYQNDNAMQTFMNHDERYNYYSNTKSE